ncbi:MAG: hypothetical protein L0Y54_21915 [Sporichthyaceae bacterium]|nr:hypothetical protein [Sporichthyaceae bacterium]
MNVELLAKRVTSHQVDMAALKPSAKTLFQQLVGASDPDRKRVLAVLGTPLYVAQAD